MQNFELVYKLGMLIIGFGGFILGLISLIRSVKKERFKKLKIKKNK